MRQVADNLRGQEYINGDDVEAIRKYIRAKNPGCSEEELSAVFADALHKIIDARICQFEEKHRRRIKDAVLKKVVKKKEFSINASEVFISCLALKLHDGSYTQSLTRWINQNQPIPVSIHEVDKLLAKIDKLEGKYLDNNPDDIFEGIEPREGERVTIAEAVEPQVHEEIQPLVYQEVSTYAENNHVETGEIVEISLTDRFRDCCLKHVKPSIKLALPMALFMVVITALVLSGLSGDNRIQGLKYRDQGRYANIAEEQMDRYLSLESRIMNKLDGLTGKRGLVLLDGLHDELKYEEVDEDRLKKWLDKRNSMLSEEPYFAAIIETSRKYDIHPVLMFAIVGQEQGFVPKNGAAAKKIANNPFNVYGSWEKYNTNIYDSSRLAANTIIESSRNRPAYIDSIRWINRRYAEDPNWWNGVSGLFAQIKKEM